MARHFSGLRGGGASKVSFRPFLESLECRVLMAADTMAAPLHNSFDAEDVNDDGDCTPLDLVMAANDCDLDTAFKFLSDHTGWASEQVVLVDAAAVLGPTTPAPAAEPTPAIEASPAVEPTPVLAAEATTETPAPIDAATNMRPIRVAAAVPISRSKSCQASRRSASEDCMVITARGGRRPKRSCAYRGA